MQEMNHQLMAQRLKQSRITRGFTQSEIAGKIGVHKTTIMRWENGGGTNHIKLPVIAALANMLRVSPSYLMGWTDEPLTPKEEKLSQIMEGVYKPEINGYVGENEASSGLKYLLAFYGLPWHDYDDALLLKMINSDLLRNFLGDCLSLLRQEKR